MLAKSKCICVKFPSRDLNPDLYSPHPKNTYSCGVTITPKRCAVVLVIYLKNFDAAIFN